MTGLLLSHDICYVLLCDDGKTRMKLNDEVLCWVLLFGGGTVRERLV